MIRLVQLGLMAGTFAYVQPTSVERLLLHTERYQSSQMPAIGLTYNPATQEILYKDTVCGTLRQRSFFAFEEHTLDQTGACRLLKEQKRELLDNGFNDPGLCRKAIANERSSFLFGLVKLAQRHTNASGPDRDSNSSKDKPESSYAIPGQRCPRASQVSSSARGMWAGR